MKKYYITRSHKEEHYCACVLSDTVYIWNHVIYNNVKRVLPGIDPTADTEEKQDFGNTLLLDIGENKYVFIGREILEFSIPEDDIIIHYYSRVDRNDIPYPVAVGKKNAYFILNSVYVPITNFPQKCISDWCYGHVYLFGQHIEHGEPLTGIPLTLEFTHV